MVSMLSIDQSDAIMALDNTRDAVKAIVDALPDDELPDAFFILMQYARADKKRQNSLAGWAKFATED